MALSGNFCLGGAIAVVAMLAGTNVGFAQDDSYGATFTVVNESEKGFVFSFLDLEKYYRSGGNDSDPNVIPVEEIIRNYANQDMEIDDINDKGFQKLLDYYRYGGPAASIVGAAVRDAILAREKCPGKVIEIKPKPIYSSMRLHHNNKTQTGYFDIYSRKELECGDLGNYYILRRWVLIVDERLDGNVDTEHPGFKWIINATGTDIQLSSYYGHIVKADASKEEDYYREILNKYLIPITHPKMKYYYERRPNACIDVVMKDRPHSNDDYAESKHPNYIMFCARGCMPGDVDATM